MFIDEAKIRVKAGDGGNGCMAFVGKNLFPALVRRAETAAAAAMC